jgi:hypothetical protein
MTTKTDPAEVLRAYTEWREVQEATLEAVHNEMNEGRWSQAATLMERLTRGQASIAVRVRSFADTQAA